MLSDDEKLYLQVSPQEMAPVKSFFLNAIQAKASVSEQGEQTHMITLS